jgi:hypothetical protein
MVEDCCCFGAQAVGAVNRGVETATRVALTFDVSPIADGCGNFAVNLRRARWSVPTAANAI